MLRGSHRDAFARRMEAQYARFYAAEVEHIRKWVERWDLEPVFLEGPPKLVEMVWEELPKALKARTVLVREDLGHLLRANLKRASNPNCSAGGSNTNAL